MTETETKAARDSRMAAIDSLVGRGASRQHLEVLSPTQFKAFLEMVVSFDAEGQQFTWTGGI